MNRLSTLAAEIHALQRVLPEHDRDAFDMGDELAIERATFTRARLDAALRCYFVESEAARAASPDCPVHGHAILVTCPECVERSPQLRPIYEAYLAEQKNDEVVGLASTLAAVEEGKAQNVEPRKTLRILEAARRSA